MPSLAQRARVGVRPASAGDAWARRGDAGRGANLRVLSGVLLGVGALTGCTTSLLRGFDGADAETDGPPEPGGAPVDSGAHVDSGSHDDSGEEGDGASESGTDTTANDPCQSFLGCDDLPELPPRCDPWTQDCEAGEKCTAISSTAGTGGFDINLCAPAGTAGIGDPCTPAEGLSGTDTCDETSICLGFDPITKMGTCVGLCIGPQTNPSCPEASGPHTRCRQGANEVLNLCIPICTPLLTGECAIGTMCTPVWTEDTIEGFTCLPPATSSPGISGEACECANCCAPMHMCVGATDYGLGCAHDQCCTEYCDTDDPSFECQGPDQVCIPLFPPGTPGFDNLGSCGVP